MGPKRGPFAHSDLPTVLDEYIYTLQTGKGTILFRCLKSPCYFSFRQVISTRTGISFFTGMASSEGGSILKSVSVAGIVPEILASAPCVES